MSKQQGARYVILGRGGGVRRIHLTLDNNEEADAVARELAAMPGQAPVAVIDCARNDSDRAVTFYFTDGSVLSVLRRPNAEAEQPPEATTAGRIEIRRRLPVPRAEPQAGQRRRLWPFSMGGDR
jgi:hypothetical protein